MTRPTLVAFVACQLLAASAFADAGDLQVYRLGNPSDGSAGAASNANFRIMSNQLAAAISSFNGAPPETLGHSGFNIAFEYQVAQIDNNAKFWPTAGATTPYLLMPSLHVRKGLGFSIELGSRISYLQSTRMAAATVEIKWALNEGFKYFPDLGVRGYGTHLFGSRDFNLTTAGLDVGLGHQFAIGGMVTLTPYAGWNMQFNACTSSVVDFNPSRSLADAVTNPTDDTSVFQSVTMPQNINQRVYLGLRLISYVFELAAEGSVILNNKETGMPQIFVFGGKVGIDF
ncbi:MAG TPA: hypothetical protein VGK67_22610 [Myxococcales bacterium]|jgi:hypothetical protein